MLSFLYFDLPCGASGDMLLASLIDLGVPVEYLQKELDRLNIPGLSINIHNVISKGITAKRLDLSWEPGKHYRHISDILSIIHSAKFSKNINSQCEDVLKRLGAAEAAVHGIPIEKVHFHEIGAVDTIIDIVGFMLCAEYLEISDIRFSALTIGYGSIESAHGSIPVPVPATTQLIEGLKIQPLAIPTEILTPTGAALLTTLGNQSIPAPSGLLRATGYGCGTKKFENHPNIIRSFLLESHGIQQDTIEEAINVLETDTDHISGELMAHVANLLFQKGALDVVWIPVMMKKGRPGYRLSVVCPENKRQSLIDLIIKHTRTLGVRFQTVSRIIAERYAGNASFMGERVTTKHCRYKESEFEKIEFENVAAISKEKDIPVPDLLEQFAKTRKGNH